MTYNLLHKIAALYITFVYVCVQRKEGRRRGKIFVIIDNFMVRMIHNMKKKKPYHNEWMSFFLYLHYQKYSTFFLLTKFFFYFIKIVQLLKFSFLTQKNHIKKISYVFIRRNFIDVFFSPCLYIFFSLPIENEKKTRSLHFCNFFIIDFYKIHVFDFVIHFNSLLYSL